MDELNSVNAEQGGIVDPQQDTAAVDTGVQSAPATQKQPQTPEENAAFAAVRRTYEAKLAEVEKKNREYEQKIAKVTEYTEYSQFDELLAEIDRTKLKAEAAEQGVDPETYARLKQLENENLTTQQKLARYELQEQLAQEEQALTADPKWSSFYKENRDEIQRIALENGTSLDVAKLVLYNEKGVFDPEAIKQQAITEYLAKLKSQNIPVEGRGGSIAQVSSGGEYNRKNIWAAAQSRANALMDKNTV
jgi:hypothetical protein